MIQLIYLNVATVGQVPAYVKLLHLMHRKFEVRVFAVNLVLQGLHQFLVAQLMAAPRWLLRPVDLPLGAACPTALFK